MGVQVFDLAVELRRRDVSAAELAAEAGVDRVTVARIARGKSAGLPRTRRALRAALRQFDPVEPLEEIDKPAVDPPPVRAASVSPPADQAAIQAAIARRREEMAEAAKRYEELERRG